MYPPKQKPNKAMPRAVTVVAGYRKTNPVLKSTILGSKATSITTSHILGATSQPVRVIRRKLFSIGSSHGSMTSTQEMKLEPCRTTGMYK